MAVDVTAVDFSTLGDTFKKVTQHMRGCFPIWEELLEKGQRLNRSFEHTQLHLASFFDAFAKIAEHSVHAKGATREIGTVMTNLVMWHKGLEMRMREMTSALQHSLMAPLASRLEEWKKTEYTIGKEHERDLSRAVKEAKEASKGTVRAERKLEEKAKKEKAGPKVRELRQQLNQKQQETEGKYGAAVAVAKRHLSRALVEERTWYCSFMDMFGKVMDTELALLSDMSHLQSIKQDLAVVTSNRHRLLEKSAQVVESIIQPTDQRGETPTNLSPRVESPVQPSASPQRVQSPPPPPPPPPSISSTPSRSSISPTPSSASTTSVPTPEVVQVEQLESMQKNGIPKQQRVIATSPAPVQSEMQPLPAFDSFSSSDPISASPAIRRHKAAVQQLQEQVGIVASPHIKRAARPPVARKPPKLTREERCATVVMDEPTSPPTSPIPRSSSYTTGVDTVREEEDGEEDSPLLAAIKQARLKRVTPNDRSTPALLGRVPQ